MSLCKINDVNIVTHTRSVMSLIVVAKNRKALASTRCDLRNIWQKIIRYSLRILTDKTALMRAYRIKITKNRNAPLVIRLIEIA